MLKAILKIIWFRSLVRQHFYAAKEVARYDDLILNVKLKIGSEKHSVVKAQLELLFNEKHKWERVRKRCMDIIGYTLKKKI